MSQGRRDPGDLGTDNHPWRGAWNSQTAPSWAKAATEGPTNAQNLVFPETGHSSLLFVTSVTDKGVAFVNDPSSKSDNSCAESLMPGFHIAARVNAADISDSSFRPIQ